ncbi:MAG: ATP-dependent zinc metalloprotease FtsH [Candidatus Collierbacteria bacterium GW2011_GWB1_44_6]|uniref:ATP-dependent zinc metalloprotease FtsH n=1 Tax=Candidatus Collierbacteria bacterium GW2011_GWB1_44_6 TaxID=1618384 RepID=A0A0G1JNK3_9BACT|nr:MAG: ATP-dependent zinc metalloprotease FtsH [Candidatus Collierbacteria bacterium GW2011_GWB1_44_6]
MVDFGMSSLGPVALGQMVESNVWGYSFGDPIKLSEDMQSKVDLEIKKKIDEAYKLAEKVLKQNRKVLDKISLKLVLVETMEQEIFEELAGKPKATFDEK